VRPLPPQGSPGLKERLVVVSVGSGDRAFTLRGLASIAGADEGVVETEIGGVRVRVDFSVAPGTAIVVPLEDAMQLEAVRHTFWFAWYALKRTIPDTIRATGAGEAVSASGPTTTTTPGGA
jgi:hypothetical protein